MSHRFSFRLMVLGLAVVGLFFTAALAQVSSTSSITGNVRDDSGSVVPGAEIKVTNVQTGTTHMALTDDYGNYNVPALPVAIYRVSATVPGFKTAVVENVALEVGVPATVNITLTVGEIAEEVTVAAGSEVVQTTSTNVATTITGRQIVELPFASRDALDLVLFLPGAVTTGRPRQTSFQGLPKGALNITTDGVNVQDNLLKGSDGFFTYIRPRIDAIEQVTVSTATPGAESAGEGAIQIKFVTKSGSNELDGSVYWYRRTTGMNSNFFFNNQFGAPRATNNLLQWGFRVGGPVLKDRFFFFANYEEFRLPEAATRNRTILSPLAEKGIFQYPGGPTGGVDVLALAAKNGLIGTPDPIISKILADIRSSTSQGTVATLTNRNFQRFTFTNPGGQTRRFPTLRLDWEVTQRHHLENIYNFNDFAGKVDFLNGVDPAYPGSPIFGSQGSDRFSNVIAWRWSINPNLINEARFGIVGGTVVFFPEVGPDLFKPWKGTALGLLGLSPQTISSSSRRNTPVFQFIENLHWNRASHNFSFGFNMTQINSWGQDSTRGQIPFTSMGLFPTDPAAAIFNQTNFPGADLTQLGEAGALYATLTGLIAGVTYTAAIAGDQYDLKASAERRDHQREFGLYGQDSWRVTPNLTFNYGLRWEIQMPFVHKSGTYTFGPYDDLYGISGPGNLFKPGAKSGRVPEFNKVTEDIRPYNRDWDNLAPSLGLAWAPRFEHSWLKTLFGESGESVFRAAYSMAFNREGMNTVISILGSNPGAGVLNLSRSVALGNLPTQTYFRNGLPPPEATSVPRTFPVRPTLSNSVNAFLPDLTPGYVQSWSAGIQRELTRDTALEVRYVSNRGIKLWRQYNINEVNIFENGFLDEFKKAQQNLAINIAGGKGRTFQNLGLAGQSALPIFEASFGSLTSQFASGFFVSALQQGLAGGVATGLALTSVFQNNRVAKGLPANLFIVNPAVFGGSFPFENGGRTSYDALHIELRRRMSGGLLLQGSYVYGKALSNIWASSSVNFASYTTLRETGYDKGFSPFDVRHAFKANWIYDLPFGPGARWQTDSGILNRIIGGWALHGTARIQSGRPQRLTSGRPTFNNNDSGIELVGLSQKDLQDLMKITGAAAPSGNLFYLPNDFIENTLRAFGLRPGAPSGRYIAPPSTPGRLGGRVFLFGPDFHRWDISVVKKTQITEQTNLELRVEFMNAFNHKNIMLSSPATDVADIPISTLGLGQTNFAYQDLSTTNDPGGRMIQLVARFNF